ncbi:hypothetical protein [Teichococcus aestuarii]|uniref:hypothetical protein n=1 Tax=Teichococcus aestuarii TaxID=568898 RepID=UPI00360EE60A
MSNTAPKMLYHALLAAQAAGEPVTPAAIRAAITEATATLPAAQEAASALEARRRAVLLSAGEAELEAMERELAAHRRRPSGCRWHWRRWSAC